MSDLDIEAGARREAKVSQALAQANFGILFITVENFSAPRLLFEGGALLNALDPDGNGDGGGLVCPYLLDLEPEAIPSENPLKQFQAKRADKQGTLDLFTSLNIALGEGRAIRDEILQESFNRYWQDIEVGLRALSPPTPIGAIVNAFFNAAGNADRKMLVSNFESIRRKWDPDVIRKEKLDGLQHLGVYELGILIKDQSLTEIQRRRVLLELRSRLAINQDALSSFDRVP